MKMDVIFTCQYNVLDEAFYDIYQLVNFKEYIVGCSYRDM